MQLSDEMFNADRSIEREQMRKEQARTNHLKGQEQKTRLIEELKEVSNDEKRPAE